MSTYTEPTNLTTEGHVSVAVFPSHEGAERAVTELQHAGFDMKKLSIVGADYHSEEHVIGYYNIGDRMKAWGRAGAFWGAIWGILFGAAFLVVPGFGPVLVAGPLVTTIVAGLESAVVVGGLSALGAALASLGIPKNSVLDYETAIRAGRYLLIVHGVTEDANRAREILAATRTEPAN
jgi:hypothetical protein